MSNSPADMIAEMFKQIGALGKQIDASDDPAAAAAQVAQSLEQLRAVIEQMDAGEDAEAAFAQATAAIEQMREGLKDADVDGGAFANDLTQALTPTPTGTFRLSQGEREQSADEMAQSLDEQSAGAFSRYRAANEAKSMEEIRKAAQANAEQSAKQVKPNLDFSDVTKRESQEDEA